MKYEINHKYTGDVLFDAEVGSFKACIELAVKSGADLREANLRNVNLYGAYLEGANLEGANFYNTDLYNADLRNADLRGADLCEANLYNTDLRGANLEGADLRHADLRNVNLSDANIRHANLYYADLRDANLRNVNLYEANLRNCCYRSAGVGGIHRRMVMCNPEQGLIQDGCFKGTLQEFKKLVIARGCGEDYGSYKGVIAYLDAEIGPNCKDNKK